MSICESDHLEKFSVETVMENSDKFYAFLKENVDPDIIHERRKNFVKGGLRK